MNVVLDLSFSLVTRSLTLSLLVHCHLLLLSTAIHQVSSSPLSILLQQFSANFLKMVLNLNTNGLGL